MCLKTCGGLVLPTQLEAADGHLGSDEPQLDPLRCHLAVLASLEPVHSCSSSSSSCCCGSRKIRMVFSRRRRRSRSSSGGGSSSSSSRLLPLLLRLLPLQLLLLLLLPILLYLLLKRWKHVQQANCGTIVILHCDRSSEEIETVLNMILDATKSARDLCRKQ